MDFHYFHLLKPKGLIPDRYYRVYYNEQGFYFIRIGGQFFSYRAFENQMGNEFVMFLIMLPFYKLSKKKQQARVQRVEEMVKKGMLDACAAEKNNFFLLIDEIEKVVIKEGSSLHTAFHDNGTVIFCRRDSKEEKFLIPKNILRKEVIEIIRVNYPSISIEFIEKWNGF